MPNCCIPECNNYWTKGTKVTFHCIPRKDLELQRAWLKRIRRDNLPPLDYSYVCSDHFTPDCFENDLKAKLMPKTKFKRGLIPGSVPSLFPFGPQPKRPRPSSEARAEQRRLEELRQEVLQQVHSQEHNANSSEDASHYEQPSTSDSCEGPTLVNNNPTPTVGACNLELPSTSDSCGGPTLVEPTVRRITPQKVKTTPKSTTTRRPRVTPHSTRRPRVTPRSTTRPHVTPTHPLPFLCKSSIRYDTVFVGPSGWTYFFVGDKYWQLDRNLRRYGPRMIKSYWIELKTPVDAAYLNRRGNIVFFKGSEFWEYNKRRKLIRSENIRRYGLPQTLGNMDAVFVWEGNNKTYFFKGRNYWKYDDNTGRIQTYYYNRRYNRYLRYPRDIRTVWKFYENVKAAVKWRNGRNYVFWDKQYVKLQKGSVRRENGYPQIISDRWMRCNVKGRDLRQPTDP